MRVVEPLPRHNSPSARPHVLGSGWSLEIFGESHAPEWVVDPMSVPLGTLQALSRRFGALLSQTVKQ
jgi:hypothetical protein